MTESKISCKNKAPNNLKQIGTTAKYTLLDYIRSRKFYILLSIAVLIGVILTLVIGYTRPSSFLSSDLSFYSSWWGNTVDVVVVLAALFFGGDAISGEFQNKTGYFSMPKPIRRSSIYLGKFLAALMASIVILVVFTAITVGNGLYYFGGVPYQFGESLLFALFYLSAVLGFTFFFSSVFKSVSMSILVTAILFLFAFTLVQGLASGAHFEPWFIPTYGAQIIGNVLISPYPPHSAAQGLFFGQSSFGFNATIPEGLLIIGVYLVITTILGLVFFERKEFT